METIIPGLCDQESALPNCVYGRNTTSSVDSSESPHIYTEHEANAARGTRCT